MNIEASDISLIYKGRYYQTDKHYLKWGKQEVKGAETAYDYFKIKYPDSNLTLNKYEYFNKKLSVRDAVLQAANNNSKIISGIVFSNHVFEAVDLINKHRMNLVSSMASSSDLKEYDRVISVFPSNTSLLKSLFSFLKGKQITFRRICVIYSADDECSINLAELIQQKKNKLFLEKSNITLFPIITRGNLTDEIKNYARNLTSNDAIFLALQNFDAAYIVNKIFKEENNPVLLSTDGFGEDGADFWPAVDKKIKNKVTGYCVFPWSKEGKRILNQNFLKLYRHKYNSDPCSLSFFTFKSVFTSLLIKMNLSKNNTLPISKIVKYCSIKNELLKNGLSFNKQGFSEDSICIIGLKNGTHTAINK
ncbi:MAG: hypothetical protein GY714_15030 [Desulfobacterales bacterium]|nr:hypothetical protein [Desulfobacterales bacterium]